MPVRDPRRRNGTLSHDDGHPCSAKFFLLRFHITILTTGRLPASFYIPSHIARESSELKPSNRSLTLLPSRLNPRSRKCTYMFKSPMQTPGASTSESASRRLDWPKTITRRLHPMTRGYSNGRSAWRRLPETGSRAVQVLICVTRSSSAHLMLDSVSVHAQLFNSTFKITEHSQACQEKSEQGIAFVEGDLMI